MKWHYLTALALGLALASCEKPNSAQPHTHILSVTSSSFGTTSDGQNAQLFTLTNSNGMEARVSEFGALLTAVLIPGEDGKPVDITLGYDTLSEWEGNPHYLGATVGRYGNRIAGANFTLDGKNYPLAINNDPGGYPCNLHGGTKGFNKHMWSAEPLEREGARGVKLTRRSPDGEEGFPGNLDVTVTYWLTEENELLWEVEGTTDAPTPINVVHHTYWNLSGDPSRTILDHELQLDASHFLTANQGMIPTGEKTPVEDTPMDFRESTSIGARIDARYEPLIMANGYDHCYVLPATQGLRSAGRLSHPETGRSLEVLTDQPGVQIYTGNYLTGTGKNGQTYAQRTGVCLETQKFPNSPNTPDFPDSILRPGETYQHKMVLKFTW